MTSADAFARMVDVDNGIVSREIFVSPEVYQRELETLFARAWLFVGHESLVPNPGDFYSSRMGEESVILCRDRQNEIHVFLNSCRHRGMKVCRYDQGNTEVFTCPYHSWAYALDGKLQGVPHYKDLYDGILDREKWSLIHVPKMANYKGTIWASWDENAPDFETYLGDAREHLDMALDCRDGRPGGSEVIGVHKWVFPSNWKFAAENFLGDTYHNPAHRSVDMIGIGPSAQSGQRGRRDPELEKAQHIWISFPQGHGVHSAIQPEGFEFSDAYRDQPEIGAYFRHCFEERRRRMGNKARLMPFVGTIFPNTSYHGGQPRGLCAWHPPSATQTEGWLYATEASRGTIARRYPFNYQQSMGAEHLNEPVPGEVSTQISEHIARGFYKRWGTYMGGGNWDALLGRDDPRFTRQAAE